MHLRILKTTSGFLTALECTKFVFGPLGELTALPRPPSWFKGAGGLLLRGGGRTGREGKG